MRWLPWIATIAWWIGMFVATHLPPAKVPTTHINATVEHFVAYFILAALLYTSLRSARVGVTRALAMTLIVLLAYAVIDEQTQKLVGRICSLEDWLADAAGVLVALACAFSLSLYSGRGRGRGFFSI